MKCTPFENMNAVKEIVQFMIVHDLPKERVIQVLNDMVSMINRKPHNYFSRGNIEHLKQEIINRFIKNDR